MKGKIIAIVVLLVIAAIIVYMLFSGNDGQPATKTAGNTAEGTTDQGGGFTDLGTVTKYDILLQSKVIECGPWSKYASDKITDGPGITKSGASRVWMDGCVYPIGDKIEGGVGTYSTKPKF